MIRRTRPTHRRRLAALTLFTLLGAGSALGSAFAQGEPPPLAAVPDPAVTARATAGEDIPKSCPYCDMSGADYSGQNLTDVNLTGANLTGAKLHGTILNGAMLTGADLTNADLTNAKLNPSKLGPADLSRAVLTGANFTGAEMNGADLQFAQMGGTNFAGLDLRRTVFGPHIAAGVASGHKTSFRHARLRHEFAVDAAAMDVAEAAWEGDVAAATGAAADDIACGRADLAPLTSRIYVAPTGTDGGTCGASAASPCKTIAYGIGRCAPSGCGVLVAWEQYPITASIALRAGVNVYGGCLPKSQARPEYFSAVNAAAGGQPVMTASTIQTATIVQGFQLNGSAATGTAAATSVALQVQDSSGLALLDDELVGHKGAEGARGTNGPDGATGGNGSGRTGGTASCSNANGGEGSVVRQVSVDVGFASVTCKPSCSANSCYGYSGYPGTTGSYAGGGARGSDNCGECVTKRGGTGSVGGNGNNAGCGGKGTPSADTRGTFSGNNWVAATGGAGSDGGIGGGGAGGGSGGYKAGACFWVGQTNNGNSGGGGGAGGCRATGGRGGQQGGAAFTVLALRSTLALTRSKVVGGTGGRGGNGGTGGRGGRGGTAAGGATNEDGGFGGTGGTGGAGGAAGGGAGGNGGPALGAALAGGATIRGDALVYYPGQSGVPGESGSGGAAIITTACTAPNGDGGKAGLTADTQSY
jgi:uncharacterized protein YjbI with pentapeptide repeats